MEKELQYLYSVKQDYLNHLVSLRNRLQRQKVLLFTSAIVLLAMQFLSLKIDELNIFGIKLHSIDISRLLFLIPLIITYQFAHYYATKVEERGIDITLKSIKNTLEEKAGISLLELATKHPHVSSHGTQYNIRHKSRFASTSVKLMNTIIWFPVGLVFIVGATSGLKNVFASGDKLNLWLYSATLCLCVAVVGFARLSAVFAYRQGKRRPPTQEVMSRKHNKSMDTDEK